MTTDEIILELMKTLMYTRSTLVSAHRHVSMITPLENVQTETEWAIANIDRTLLKVQSDLLPEQKCTSH